MHAILVRFCKSSPIVFCSFTRAKTLSLIYLLRSSREPFARFENGGGVVSVGILYRAGSPKVDERGGAQRERRTLQAGGGRLRRRGREAAMPPPQTRAPFSAAACLPAFLLLDGLSSTPLGGKDAGEVERRSGRRGPILFRSYYSISTTDSCSRSKPRNGSLTNSC